MMNISRKKFMTPLTAGLLACSAITLVGCGLNREPPPRYNTVLGEKRAPVLNPKGQGLTGLPYASAPPYPIPPGPPPYPATDGVPPPGTVSVVPMPETPQTMAGMEGAPDERAVMPMAAPMPMRQQAPMPPVAAAEEESWYSGVTHIFSDDEEDVIQQQAAMPRKMPMGNREETVGVNAVPVDSIASAPMEMPPQAAPMDMPMPEESATLMEMPADEIPPASPPPPAEEAAAQPISPPPAPVQMQQQSYPVLAETPPPPVDAAARVQSAQQDMQAMQTQAPAPEQPVPMPASEWKPLEEEEMAAPAPMPEPMPAPVQSGSWQPVSPVEQAAPLPAVEPQPDIADATWEPVLPPPPADVQEPSLPPLPPPSATEYAPEPVEIVRDVPASTDGLPPITLIPPPSVVADSAQTARRSPYIAPSRYEQRREVERPTTLR